LEHLASAGETFDEPVFECSVAIQPREKTTQQLQLQPACTLISSPALQGS
jgi:hypothetical protein